MQNAACSSSTCEPGAPAPNTSASLKPLKIHGCFSQMCWGKQADGSHLFSATVEHLALSTMIFWWKTANMPAYWEHLCWSRGIFFVLREKLPVLWLSEQVSSLSACKDRAACTFRKLLVRNRDRTSYSFLLLFHFGFLITLQLSAFCSSWVPILSLGTTAWKLAVYLV